MNENLTKFFNALESGATWSAGVAFKRAAALPLDRYSVFATYAEAEEYATEGAVAYPGQVIAAVKDGKNNELGIYYITEERTLKEVGTTTLGDNDSIVLTENADGTKTLSIKGFAGAANNTKLIKNSEGKLAWIADSSTEIEGNISGLKSRVESAEENIAELDTKITNLGTVFELKATVTSTQFNGWAGSVATASDNLGVALEAGDVILVSYTDAATDHNYNQEYVVVNKTTTNEEGEETTSQQFELLGDPSGVTALTGRVTTVEEKASNNASAIDAVDEKVDNLKTYVDEQDTATLSSAKSYADEVVDALEKGAVATNASAITALQGRASSLESATESLNSSKVDKTTYDSAIASINESLGEKLDSTTAASTYLRKDDASTKYATSATVSGLESSLQTTDSKVSALETTVNGNDAEGSTGLVGDVSALQTSVSTLTGVSNTTVENVAALTGRVSQNETDIASLKTATEANEKAISDETTNRTSEITRVEGLITAEASTARAAEKKNADAISALDTRVGTNESDISTLQSTVGEHATSIEKNASDISNLSKKVTDDYETKADATAKLDVAKAYTDTEIADVESTIDALKTDIGKLSNVMNFVGPLTEGTGETFTEITDSGNTEYKGDTTLKIEGRDGIEPGDVGYYNQQEYVCIEVSDSTSYWLAIGAVGATEARFVDIEEDITGINETIDTLATKAEVETVNSTLTTAVGANKTAIDGEIARATAAEGDLDTAVKANATAIAEETTRAKKAEEDLGTEIGDLTTSVEEMLSWGEF